MGITTSSLKVDWWKDVLGRWSFLNSGWHVFVNGIYQGYTARTMCGWKLKIKRWVQPCKWLNVNMTTLIYIYRLDNAMHAFLVSIIFCLSITTSGWDILNNPQLTCWQAGCWPTRWFQKLRKRLSQQQKLQQWWLGWLSLQPLVGLDYCLHSMSCLLWEIWSEFGFLFVFLQKWKTKINMIIWTSRWWFVCSKKRAV